MRLGSYSRNTPGEVVCDPRLFQTAYHRRAPVTPEEVAVASALHEVVHLLSSRFDEERPIPKHWSRLLGEAASRPAPLSEEPVDLLTALGRTGGELAALFFFALRGRPTGTTGVGQLSWRPVHSGRPLSGGGAQPGVPTRSFPVRGGMLPGGGRCPFRGPAA